MYEPIHITCQQISVLVICRLCKAVEAHVSFPDIYYIYNIRALSRKESVTWLNVAMKRSRCWLYVLSLLRRVSGNMQVRLVHFGAAIITESQQ